MFNEIIVGVDDLEQGRDPIALAKRLVGEDARFTLAHVLTTEPYVYRGAAARYATAEQALALERREEEHALALLANARDQASLADERCECTLRCVRSASVGRGLRELAEVEGADLLVLGSSRESVLGRVWIGNDTHAALNGAPCAVAIAPGGFSEHPVPMREIGVGYDGSIESAHALEVARELACDRGVKLSALTAVSVPTAAFGLSGGPLGDAIDALVRDAHERIEALGGVEPHTAYGAAVEELTLYSASLDLLVVGSRGYGPIGRLIHGSTSARLTRTARCALLVLPRASARRDFDPHRTVLAAKA